MAILNPIIVQWLLGIAFAFTPMVLFFEAKYYSRAFFNHTNRLKRNHGSRSTFSSTVQKPQSSLEEHDYQSTFPPSRRSFCTKLKSVATKSPKDRTHPNASQDAKFISCTSSATGFTPEEIQMIGHFPDYAELSGVPLPKPCLEFKIETALPRPYRPFRWVYHQTMALSKLDTDYWLELEQTYIKRIKQRQDIFAKHGKAILDYLPGSDVACRELMEMCLQFLCARYPQYFILDIQNMVFHNKILQTRSDLRSTHPLQVILNNIPEDFVITLRNPEDGTYYLRAGVICSSMGWALGTKMGLSLREIHGTVPDYKEKMHFSMQRFFATLPTDKPIKRGSWAFQLGDTLFAPPGDPYNLNSKIQLPDTNISHYYLRVDYQTLRRLPLSGAIVFNFKGLFTPITSFRDEPYIPSIALKVLKEGKRNLMEHKDTWHTEHVVIPALEAYEQEQLERGLIVNDWEPCTLDEYPWFPGWEEKWHREQGF